MTVGPLLGWKVAKADPKIASFRHRALSIVRLLREQGHRVELFSEDNVDRYDAVVFSKTYSASSLEQATALRARGAKVVFDICDNHFYNPYDLPRYRQIAAELVAMLALADVAICSSAALGRVIQAETSGAISPIVIGDFVEVVAPLPDLSSSKSDRKRLLWFGSHGSPNAPSGMDDLTLIAHELQQANARTTLDLVICSNNEAKFNAQIAPLPLTTHYVEWSPQSVRRCLAEADAVVIPVSPNPFTACKTHNRLTMALHAGIPVVADRIEAYEEFAHWCTLGDWNEGLRSVLESNAEARAQARAARSYMDEHWSPGVIAGQWAAALGLPNTASTLGMPIVKASLTPPSKPTRRKAARTAAVLSKIVLQGAVDSLAVEDITGWVRPLSGPPRELRVRLETDKGVLASTPASEARTDLALVGFSEVHCGFRFSLHDLPPDSLEEPFRVVVEETGWTVADTYHRALSSGAHGYVVLPETLTTGPSAAKSSSELSVVRPRQRAAVEIASRAQDLLVSEMERFSLAVEEARQSAARLIVSIGDDPRHARRVIAALNPKIDTG